MKRILFIFVLSFISFSNSVNAQKIAVGLDGYTTNMWMALIVPGLSYALPIHVSRDVPDAYPAGRISSPYRRTFSHPFHRFGNLAVGPTVSLQLEDKPLGFYAALRYKTEEAYYKRLKKGHDNDRAHYIQPEIGVRYQGVTLGMSYNAVIGYDGHVNDFSKDAVNSGFNLVLGYTVKSEKGESSIYYTHPLYNFYDTHFSPDGGITHPLQEMKYKIGYFTASYRLFLDD